MKPDFILFNGCSFTEGGGLENADILNQYGYSLNRPYPQHFEIRNELRFSNILSKKFNCRKVNISESCNSNENIFQTTFDYIHETDLSEYKNKIAIIQLTMPQRKTIFWNGQKYNLNSYSFSDSPYNDNPKFKPLFDYYSNFILNIFDEEYQSKIDKKEIYLLNSYLILKGFKPYFILYDYFLLENEEVSIINFEGEKNLKNHIENNKLRISDDIDSTDGHFSPAGHKNIAELLYKNITND